MDPTTKCELCDTPIEYQADGVRYTFKAHDDAFCRGATKLRIRALTRAAEGSAEAAATAEARLQAALRRADVESGILGDALARAMLLMDRGDEHRELERLVERFDETVARELEKRVLRTREKSAAAAALVPPMPEGLRR